MGGGGARGLGEGRRRGGGGEDDGEMARSVAAESVCPATSRRGCEFRLGHLKAKLGNSKLFRRDCGAKRGLG